MTGVPEWGPWPFVAGASVQGRDHRSCGTENQDAFAAVRSGDAAAVVIAVSDGAGSRKRSSLGSHIAVDVACRTLAAGLPPAQAPAQDWQAWLSTAGRQVVDDYVRIVSALPGPGADDQERAATTQAMAATLAAAAICPPWVAFLAIGDCFGAVLTAGSPESCHLVLPPEGSDGLTVFLSSSSARARIRSFVLWEPDLSGVLLATDGCAPLALDHPARAGLSVAAGPQPAAGFFVGLAQAVRANDGDGEPIHALLSSEQAARSGDDLTVLCALAGTDVAETSVRRTWTA